MAFRPFLMKHRTAHLEAKAKETRPASSTEPMTDAKDLIQAVLEASDIPNQERVDTLVCNAIKTLKVTRFKPDQSICLALLYLTKVRPHCFVTKPIVESLMAVLKRDLCPAFKVKNNTILPLVAGHIMMAAHTDVRQWPNGLSLAIYEEYNRYPLKGLEYVPQNLCFALRQTLLHEFDISMLVSFVEFLVNHDKDINGLGDELANFVICRHMTIRHIITNQNHQKHTTFVQKTFADVFNKQIDNLLSANNGDDDDVTMLTEDTQDSSKTNVAAQRHCEGEFAYVRVFNRLTQKNPDETRLIKLKQNTIWGMLYSLTLKCTEDSKKEYDTLHSYWFHRGTLAQMYKTKDADASVPLPGWLRLEFVLMGANDRDFINAGIGDPTNSRDLVAALTSFGIDSETADFVLKRLDEASERDARAVRTSIKDTVYVKQTVESLWELGHKYGHRFVDLALC